MKGILLTNGVILGDDGKRYLYSPIDIREENPLKKGDRLDFIPQEQNAKEIFLIIDTTPPQTQDLTFLKILGVVGCIIGMAGGFFIIPTIASLVVFLYIFYRIGQISGSKTLFKNYFISSIAIGLSIIIALFIIGPTFIFSISSNSFTLFNSGIFTSFFMVFVIILLGSVICFVYLYKSMSELSIITNNGLFKWYAIFYLIGNITLFLVIGGFILILGYILFLFGWLTMDTIRPSREI
ncbi:DUF996 domain-containing protein [Helicobacter sp. 11S03491-1]|uniref:DUF996 domain-containing protein n=1 Tax=Helicobacter sp. 11S03491-1 TaxID=1476196 RepID=UPI000BA797EA|nr:DUF996 domain-containing protein [Helicobacter sp. 11S03491-1]PAF43887.1 hypothetical protein BKH45_01085 [Helicobacter sp. 11S03491-1]